MEDSRCKEGYVEMKVTESKLLKHANEVYTIGTYRLFEGQFMKFLEYCQGLVTIPNKYILKRWTKNIDLSLDSSIIGDVGKNIEKDIAEEGFGMMKDKIASEVGPYYVDNSDNEVSSSNIKDPVERRAKRERNIRKKRIVEINCNQVRGKRKSSLTHASRIKTSI
ncbi:hypothetical protein M9H77_07856 [Catharanthus roseus]|uniref:Uncharacterized protein n=1 Tax=Catharanthus roseus TaxID=4058 RepID=A0ACC0BW50_CATRO|nr:hypothetical protein M9H77_07856 [Catharanthus roseus]